MTFTEFKTILQQITDPAERLEFVMDFGRSLPPVPVGAGAVEIRGCASKVEIYRDGKNNYFGAADSTLVRGIVAVLLSMVQGKSADQIRGMNLYGELNDLNLQLGAGRMNGASGIISFLEGM